MSWLLRTTDPNSPNSYGSTSFNLNYRLGICHYFGYETKIDHKEAARYFKLAADQGVPEAQHAIAICYILGRGVPKNRQEAYKYIYKCASKIPLADLIKRQLEQYP
jgi:TPR repeat protein